MKMKRIAALLMAGVMALSQGMIYAEDLTGGEVIEQNEEIQDGSILEDDIEEKNIISGGESVEDTKEISEVNPVEAGNSEMIPIDADHFPDEIFRDYVSRNFDKDYNGVLDNGEISAVTYINVNWTDNGAQFHSLEGIEFFPNLITLCCSNNGMSSLDVSKNTALTRLECDRNNLSSLDISKITALTLLNCGDNNLNYLDVSKNLALTELSCSRNQLNYLDVSKNTALL